MWSLQQQHRSGCRDHVQPEDDSASYTNTEENCQLDGFQNSCLTLHAAQGAILIKHSSDDNGSAGTRDDSLNSLMQSGILWLEMFASTIMFMCMVQQLCRANTGCGSLPFCLRMHLCMKLPAVLRCNYCYNSCSLYMHIKLGLTGMGASV